MRHMGAKNKYKTLYLKKWWQIIMMNANEKTLKNSYIVALRPRKPAFNFASMRCTYKKKKNLQLKIRNVWKIYRRISKCMRHEN